jgi:hypothetical protein
MRLRDGRTNATKQLLIAIPHAKVSMVLIVTLSLQRLSYRHICHISIKYGNKWDLSRHESNFKKASATTLKMAVFTYVE